MKFKDNSSLVALVRSQIANSDISSTIKKIKKENTYLCFIIIEVSMAASSMYKLHES